MIKTVEFYLGMSVEMKNLGCSEMCVKTDDMLDLITRLRQAENDAARFNALMKMNCSREIGKSSIIIQRTDGGYDFQRYSSISNDEIIRELDEAMNGSNN